MNAQVHKNITADAVLEAATSGESAGFCIACGAQTDGVEPDAREYRCDECGQPTVYGAEELLLEGLVHGE